MQLKQFTKPIQKVTELAAEMKRFLRGHRVQAVRQEFVADGEHSCWSDRVEYLDGGASKEGGAGPAHVRRRWIVGSDTLSFKLIQASNLF